MTVSPPNDGLFQTARFPIETLGSLQAYTTPPSLGHPVAKSLKKSPERVPYWKRAARVVASRLRERSRPDVACDPLKLLRPSAGASVPHALTDKIRMPISGRGRYNALVITRGIREFVARDWVAMRASKDRYWGERIDRLGPLEGLRIAEELRRQALLLDATWPDPRCRRDDLLTHALLAQLFRRAGAARLGALSIAEK